MAALLESARQAPSQGRRATGARIDSRGCSMPMSRPRPLPQESHPRGARDPRLEPGVLWEGSSDPDGNLYRSLRTAAAVSRPRPLPPGLPRQGARPIRCRRRGLVGASLLAIAASIEALPPPPMQETERPPPAHAPLPLQRERDHGCGPNSETGPPSPLHHHRAGHSEVGEQRQQILHDGGERAAPVGGVAAQAAEQPGQEETYRRRDAAGHHQ